MLCWINSHVAGNYECHALVSHRLKDEENILFKFFSLIFLRTSRPCSLRRNLKIEIIILLGVQCEAQLFQWSNNALILIKADKQQWCQVYKTEGILYYFSKWTIINKTMVSRATTLSCVQPQLQHSHYITLFLKGNKKTNWMTGHFS